MTAFLSYLIMCSVSGSLMTLLGFGMRTLFRKYSMAYWYYAVLILAAVMMLCPVQRFLELPRLIQVELSQPDTAAYVGTGVPVAGAGAAGRAGFPVGAMVLWLWFFPAAGLLGKNMLAYHRFHSRLRRFCTETEDDEVIFSLIDMREKLRVRREIQVWECPYLESPMLVGVLHPKIILPRREYQPEALSMIFAHELTHYRHRDITVKLLTVLVSCVHWFNPAAHLLRRQIQQVCELCCDEAVLEALEMRDKKDYGRLLLSVMEGKQRIGLDYSTAMASSKKHIQQRLSRIAGFQRVTRAVKTLGILGILLTAVCSVSAFGITQAASVAPEELKPVLTSALPRQRRAAGEPVTHTAAPQIQQTEPPAQTIQPEATDGPTMFEPDAENSPEPEPTAVPDTAAPAAGKEDPAKTDAPARTDGPAGAENSGKAGLSSETIPWRPEPEPGEQAEDESGILEWRENPQEMQTGGPAMVYLPQETRGYLCRADFSETDVIESDRLYITEDVTLKAENLGGGALSMYELLPDGGETLVFDNEDYLETHNIYISVPVQAGRIYFLRLENVNVDYTSRRGFYVSVEE